MAASALSACTRRRWPRSIAWSNLVREEKIDCDFSRCGHLEVACKQKHFDDYARQVEVIAREFNHQLRIVPRAELQSEIGSSIYYGGMVDEVSAGLNPARYVAGLARAAIRGGRGDLREHASGEDRARSAARDASAGESRPPAALLWAREVFVGTSGYTGAATPALRKKIIPIGSYIITTEVLPETLARELSPRNRMIYDSKNYLYYYRLTPDNRMLFGGRAAFFPETADSIRRSAEILRRGMIDVYPQLRDVKVEYVWGGTLDFAFDIMPHAGQMDGIYYAVGYAGHGVAMATWQGQKMAEHDRRREAGESVCRHSVSRCAAWAVQREAVVPAVCRGLVQVSGLGELKANRRSSA